MFVINSWMSTVLPTPAPPNKPILPPFWYGHKRSITLIPVSKISDSVDCSSKEGAFLWIGSYSFTFGGSFSSIGSPRTLNIRPNVSSPTGTQIGAPVATASMPRTRPSVGPMAIQRTVSSPKCCATSTTSLSPSCRLMWIASLISGRFPSWKRISSTAPTIWVITPRLVLLFSAIFYLLTYRWRTSNNLCQFLSNCSLSCTVILQSQGINHLLCVTCCRIHRLHTRTIFTGHRFHERTKD